MNSVELKKQLAAMIPPAADRTFYGAVVDAIIGVYMTRGTEYDAPQAVETMRGFIARQVLVF